MEGLKPKEITDLEFVMTLIKHIENPCEDGQGNNVRSVYLREARRILPTIKNPFALKALESTLKKYEE